MLNDTITARFPKQRRLTSSHDFTHVFQSAKKISTHGIIILYRPNQLGFARLGLAISKKFIAKAVKRNQLKRKLRETFRVANLLGSYDCVVVVRSRMQTFPPNGVLNELWQRLTHETE